jgi:hypothetical protein
MNACTGAAADQRVSFVAAVSIPRKYQRGAAPRERSERSSLGRHTRGGSRGYQGRSLCLVSAAGARSRTDSGLAAIAGGWVSAKGT